MAHQEDRFTNSKLAELTSGWGFENTEDMLRAAVPGICYEANCNYSTEVEPDCREDYCEECEKGTVRSSLILAGVI